MKETRLASHSGASRFLLMAFLITSLTWERWKQIKRMERNVLHKLKVSGKQQGENRHQFPSLGRSRVLHGLPWLGAKQRELSLGSTQGAMSKGEVFPIFSRSTKSWEQKCSQGGNSAVCFFRLFCQMLCMFVTTKNNITESFFCLLRSKLLLKATKDSVAFF